MRKSAEGPAEAWNESIAAVTYFNFGFFCDCAWASGRLKFEGEAIGKGKASLPLVGLECESFDAKSMLASTFHCLMISSSFWHHLLLISRMRTRRPIGVLSFRNEILEMVGPNSSGWFGIE
jgi:hypothetical protein